MVKEEPSFNIWGEISDSELVLEVAEVEQKYEKQQEKRRFSRDFPRNFAGNYKNKCYCKTQIDHNFPCSTIL